MYSKNDYRYYLENQLVHSNDFLVHYGVKGMKWKQHKAAPALNNAVFNNPEAVKTVLAEQDRGKARTYQEKTRELRPANSKPVTTKQSTPKKKKSIREKAAGLRKKYGLYRTTPKGKKLKGGGNIYVSHS